MPAVRADRRAQMRCGERAGSVVPRSAPPAGGPCKPFILTRPPPVGSWAPQMMPEVVHRGWDGFPDRRGGARRAAARAALARLLWDEAGERRVPPAATLDRALSPLPGGELERICEFNPFGPVYFIPTPPFLRALARRIRSRGARRVLEVAAGDGHLSRALSVHAPDLRVVASDSGKWEQPRARMNARERREMRGKGVAG